MRQGTWQNSGRTHSRAKSGPFSTKHHDSAGLMQYFTVFVYIVCVSLPAVSLGIYYTCLWDPNYLGKGLALDQTNKANLTSQPLNRSNVEDNRLKCDCGLCPNGKQPRDVNHPKISLQNILVSVSSSTKPTPK